MESVIKYLQKHLYIGLLSIIFITLFAMCYGKFGTPLADTGRELFVPYAIANFGALPYKDMISIYGPLAHLLNALFVKLFGASFLTYYLVGGFLGYIFTIFFFRTAKFFFKQRSAFLLTLLVLVVSVFAPSLQFNFIFPYAYAALYGAVFALLALYFGLKFLTCGENRSSYLYFAAVFLSLAVLSKIDFILLLVPLAALLFFKKRSGAVLIKVFACLIASPVLVFGLLMAFGVHLADFYANFIFVKKMINSPSLAYFYKEFSGLGFNPKATVMIIKASLPAFLMILTPFLPLYLKKHIKNKAVVITCFAAVFIALFIFFSGFLLNGYYLFAYLPQVIALVFALEVALGLKNYFAKTLKPLQTKDFTYYFLIIFALCASAKVFFFMFLLSYGIMAFPFVILAFAAILKKHFGGFPVFEPYAVFVCAFLTFFFALHTNSYIVNGAVKPLNTSRGKVFVQENPNVFYLLGDVIKEKTTENDVVVGLPEGTYFNFIYNRKYNIYPSTFSPLDFDAYGEEFLINEVKKAQPKIIFFTPRKANTCNKAPLCTGYGVEFCKKILKGYKRLEDRRILDLGYRVYIKEQP